jgi:hypothetical protein
MGIHKLLNWGLSLVVPTKFVGVVTFLELLSVVAFSVVYVYLLWDFVSVFLPFLRVKVAPNAVETRSEAEHE